LNAYFTRTSRSLVGSIGESTSIRKHAFTTNCVQRSTSDIHLFLWAPTLGTASCADFRATRVKARGVNEFAAISAEVMEDNGSGWKYVTPLLFFSTGGGGRKMNSLPDSLRRTSFSERTFLIKFDTKSASSSTCVWSK